MKIISADERLREQTGVKMAVFGGVGKTSLLKTLDEPTLCLDFEAGLLAVKDWNGDSISVRTWDEARDIACMMGGPNPASKTIYGQRKFVFTTLNRGGFPAKDRSGRPEEIEKARLGKLLAKIRSINTKILKGEKQ